MPTILLLTLLRFAVELGLNSTRLTEKNLRNYVLKWIYPHC